MGCGARAGSLASLAVHHEGTKDTKGLGSLRASGSGATTKPWFLWLQGFVSFVSFVPSW